MKNIGILLIIALFVGFAYFIFSRSESQNNADMMELQEQHSPELADGENNAMMLADNSLYEITSSNVNYYQNVQGYFARPVSAENFPGVVMIHEWWGLNQNIKDMADKLAGQGYQVLAVDLYNGQVAEDAGRARELVSSVDQEESTKNLQAASKYLRDNSAEKIASMGWCFGGGQSLQLAVATDQGLDATVIYYGSVTDDQLKLGNINWPVLGIFGSEDSSIPVDEVEKFQTALNSLGIENDINIYQGVGHAFANPSGANYSPEETKDAWEKTLNFLQNNLK